jgi:hypothetical protein
MVLGGQVYVGRLSTRGPLAKWLPPTALQQAQAAAAGAGMPAAAAPPAAAPPPAAAAPAVPPPAASAAPATVAAQVAKAVVQQAPVAVKQVRLTAADRAPAVSRHCRRGPFRQPSPLLRPMRACTRLRPPRSPLQEPASAPSHDRPPASEQPQRRCTLCQGGGDAGLGPFMPVQIQNGQLEWVHRDCALWSPEVSVDSTGRLVRWGRGNVRGRGPSPPGAGGLRAGGWELRRGWGWPAARSTSASAPLCLATPPAAGAAAPSWRAAAFLLTARVLTAPLPPRSSPQLSLAAAVRRGMDTGCTQCGRRGATLSCWCARTCGHELHLPCARKMGCHLSVSEACAGWGVGRRGLGRAR